MKKLSLLMLMAFLLPWLSGQAQAADANGLAKAPAVMAEDGYTITVTTTGNGTVTLRDAGGNTYESGEAIPASADITIVFTAGEGSHLASAYLSDWDLLETSEISPDGTYWLGNLFQDETVVASFVDDANGPSYCTFEGNSKWSANNNYSGTRCTTKLNIANADGVSYDVTDLQSGYTPAIYWDKTEVVATFHAGETVSLTPTFNGSWMHSYVWVDYDNNGEFTADLDANLVPTATSELAGFSNYGGGNGTNWHNSQGTSLSGGGDGVNAPIPFTIPADLAPGDYRIRFILDWDAIDPCPNGSRTKNYIEDNGGVIVDFTLRIEKVETPVDENCDVITPQDIILGKEGQVAGTSCRAFTGVKGSQGVATYGGASQDGNVDNPYIYMNSWAYPMPCFATETSGGKLKKIVVKWNTSTDKGLNVYASNDVIPEYGYGSMQVGTLDYNFGDEEATFEVPEGSEYTHFALRPNNGNVGMTEINVYWEGAEAPKPAKPVVSFDAPENGTMTVSLDEAPFTIEAGTPAEVEAGTTIEIRLIPAEGYTLESLTANGETLETQDADGAMYIARYVVTEDVNLQANFTEVIVAKEKFAVTFEKPAEARVMNVTVDNSPIASGTELEEGTEVKVSVNSIATGYSVQYITINGTPVAFNRQVNGAIGEYIFTIEGNTEIAAHMIADNLEKQDYCAPEGKSTHASRYTRGIDVTGANGTSATISGLQSSTGQDIYHDATEQVVVLEAGEEVTVKADYVGEWMHAYLYVDYNKDGVFSTDGLADYLPTKITELVAYTTFNRGQAKGGSDEYVDSEGTSRAGSYHAGNAMKFTLPASLLPGNYRVRLKVDWSDLAACPDLNRTNDKGESNSILKNGGVIADFTIRIHGDRTVKVASNDETLGTAAIIEPETDEATVTTDVDVKVKATVVDEDAYFVNWTNDQLAVVATTEEYTYNGGDNITLRANFRKHYKLTVNDPENASRFADDNGVAYADGDMIDDGTVLTMTFEPASRVLTSIKVNGVDCTLDLAIYGHVRFVMDRTTTVDVTYKAPSHLFSVEQDGEGAVFAASGVDGNGGPDGEIFSDGSSIDEGSEVYIVVSPAAGQKVQKLAVNGKTYVEAGETVNDENLTYFAERKRFNILHKVEGPLTVSVEFANDHSGVETIDANEAGDVEFYNLHGVRVARENLVPGVYVRVNAAGASKVYVK